MNLEFYRKDPDKAYISNRLWLPKRHIRPHWVKSALEFSVPTPDGQIVIHLWEESEHHIITPREFVSVADYPKYDFEFVDLRPTFQKVEFQDLVIPRNEDQEKAWQALATHDNGIFNLACGKGKTKLALKKIAQVGAPTLVVVPDGGIMDQWERAIYGDDTEGREQDPGLNFKGRVGIISGKKFEWQKPLVIALVTTLWQKIEKGEVPEEMFRYYGLIVYDEVHQIGAPKFSLTAPPFFGNRIGLTATVKREDGLDPIYTSNIGLPFYTDLTQDLIPDIFFQRTPVMLDPNVGLIGATRNISLVRSALGVDLTSNIYRYWHIKTALDQGRKVLCLSHSKAQLKLMHAIFPESGIIIQETPKHERTDVLRNSRVCFAISRLGSQGVDDDELDLLFWLTPFKAKTSLQQSMGRIQRFLPGKPNPIFVIFEDWTMPTLKRMCQSVRRDLKHWGYTFNQVNPSIQPQTLPPELQGLYDDELRRLSEQDLRDEEG